ncbi:uncharacterized protein TNCV_3077431 [Trichonephila clavipes]|nr:uncharacterized protein TNCV_3077431 [Trichonephila clavipes]
MNPYSNDELVDMPIVYGASDCNGNTTLPDRLPHGRGSRVVIVAGFVTSFSPVPLKTHRVGERCALNLSKAQTPSLWCGVVVRREGASSGVIHVT